MDSKAADLEEDAGQPTMSLRDRRKSKKMLKKDTDPNYLKSYDGDAEQDIFDPLENNKKLSLAMHQSGQK